MDTAVLHKAHAGCAAERSVHKGWSHKYHPAWRLLLYRPALACTQLLMLASRHLANAPYDADGIVVAGGNQRVAVRRPGQVHDVARVQLQAARHSRMKVVEDTAEVQRNIRKTEAKGSIGAANNPRQTAPGQAWYKAAVRLACCCAARGRASPAGSAARAGPARWTTP